MSCRAWNENLVGVQTSLFRSGKNWIRLNDAQAIRKATVAVRALKFDTSCAGVRFSGLPESISDLNAKTHSSAGRFAPMSTTIEGVFK